MSDSKYFRFDQGGESISATHPLPVSTSPGVSSFSDLSGTITTGGTAQSIAANATRTKLVIANPDASEDLWVAFNGLVAASNGQGSIRIPAGATLSFNGDAPVSAVSIIGATSGHKFTAWEG